MGRCEIPSSGFPYWLFQGLTTANNVQLMNAAGTQTSFDNPNVIDALQYWVDLSKKDGIHPPGVIEWGTTPKDFFERRTAMMWTTTGNLTNVRKNATFPFGVAMLPAHQGRGSPTGGGNFYFFKKMSDDERAAAFKFVKWMTTPERAADWGIQTGYVAVRPDAWDTDAMKKYVADFPAGGRGARSAQICRRRAVDPRQSARHQGAQRRPAGGAHRRQDAGAGDEGRASRSRAHLAVLSVMPGAEPAASMSAAAAPPARLRLSAQIHGWLLLLPAAVLLVTFTHYPAVATIIDSFFSTPKGDRAAVFVGLDNYQAMLGDPVFWQRALKQHRSTRSSVIPLTIALSLSMAIWVNGKIAGRPFLRLSFFTPTVLPMIAVANIWLFFYAPGYGLLDQMLGVFGIPAHNWLGEQLPRSSA